MTHIKLIAFLAINLGVSLYGIVEQNRWEHFLDYTSSTCSHPSLYVYEPMLGKKIIYMAVEQTSDLNHPTIQKITSIIASHEPQLCILEGFNCEEGTSPSRILKIAETWLADGKCPDNVYAAYLCNKHNIPFIGGDLHNKYYGEALLQRGYSEEDLVFWMLARHIPYWNRDGIVTHENFHELAQDLIQNNITFWLDKPVLDYTPQQFLQWHEKQIGNPLDFTTDFRWTSDATDFIPKVTEDATIYQKIQSYIMPLRDMHMIKMMQKYINDYTTIFVIFGVSHYEWQKKLLERLFNAPTERILLNH